VQSDFEDLVDRYARLLAAVARRVCGRRYRSLLPDVEQEIRLALWKRLRNGGNEIRHPASYLYKVALATSLGVIRRYRPASEDLAGDPPAGPADTASLRMWPPERARLVEEALASLEADAARAVRGYLTGLNHKELAALYGWSPAVARHLVYRSLERLRKSLGVGE
jgi:RNA polymerase sigma factor (sigma-70 family)